MLLRKTIKIKFIEKVKRESLTRRAIFEEVLNGSSGLGGELLTGAALERVVDPFCVQVETVASAESEREAAHSADESIAKVGQLGGFVYEQAAVLAVGEIVVTQVGAADQH